MVEVMRVFANEWIKLLRRRRLWVAAVLALLTVGLMGVVAVQAQRQAAFNRPQAQLQSAQQQLAMLRRQPAGTPGATQEIAAMKQNIAQLQQQIDVSAGSQWPTALTRQVQLIRQQMALVPVAQQAHSLQWNENLMTVRQDEWELQHHVQPLQDWQPSAYQNVMQYLSLATRLFLPLVVVILMADLIAGEATDGTIKLLLVRPVSRSNIVLGKWLAGLAATALSTVVICAALCGVSVAVLGMRGANQPQWVGLRFEAVKTSALQLSQMSGGPAGGAPSVTLVPQYSTATLLPMWHYLLTSVGLITFAMLVVATVTLLCSTLFRSAMASTGVAIGMVIFGYVLAMTAVRGRWATWLFPMHLALFDSWTGAASQHAGMNVSLLQGEMVLVIWGVVALAVTLFYFSRRDVLND